MSLIPVCRNLLEIKYGNDDNNYNLMCSLVHYRDNSDKIIVKDLKPIFKNTFGITIKFNQNKKILEILFENINILLNNSLTNDISLDNKIILAIGMRIISEMIFNKYDSSLKKSVLEFGKEYARIEKYLTEAQKELFTKVIIFTPEFIHFNSFMYEPLIDVSTTELQLLCKEVYKEAKNNNIEICKIQLRYPIIS